MKLEEFNKFIEDVTQEQKNIFDMAIKLYKDGIYDLEEYKKIGAYTRTWYRQDGFLEIIEVQSDNIEDYEISDLIKMLAEFKREHKKVKEIGKSNIEEDYYCENEYLSYYRFKYFYYKISSNKLESHIKNIIKTKIAELLKPEKEINIRIPDCSMLQLFKDGSIDWETLQKITYKDCDI